MIKKVYICAPLGGNIKENFRKALNYSKYALKCGTAPVVPHFYTLCLNVNDTAERKIGIEAAQSLLWFCDELWVFGEEITEGMQKEIDFFEALNCRVRYVKDYEVEKTLGGKL